MNDAMNVDSLGKSNSTQASLGEKSKIPTLSHKTLTWVLILMCAIPVVVIICIWQLLPNVEEKQLLAKVSARDLPAAEHYLLPLDSRPELKKTGKLVVTNIGDGDWTQYNIEINRQYAGSYQIMEHLEPIRAGETKEFELDRFVSRAGARFDLRYNPLKTVRIYARLPSSVRATYYYSFETGLENE
ncbi:MAG: hypothetical protein R3C03_18435 [Pirellulaceae bacterium]